MPSCPSDVAPRPFARSNPQTPPIRRVAERERERDTPKPITRWPLKLNRTAQENQAPRIARTWPSSPPSHLVSSRNRNPIQGNLINNLLATLSLCACHNVKNSSEKGHMIFSWFLLQAAGKISPCDLFSPAIRCLRVHVNHGLLSPCCVHLLRLLLFSSVLGIESDWICSLFLSLCVCVCQSPSRFRVQDVTTTDAIGDVGSSVG